jgi:hypothetical protein
MEITNEHPLEMNSMLVVSLRGQLDRSTGQIVKIEVNIQSEPKQIFQCQLHSSMPTIH